MQTVLGLVGRDLTALRAPEAILDYLPRLGRIASQSRAIKLQPASRFPEDRQREDVREAGEAPGQSVPAAAGGPSTKPKSRYSIPAEDRPYKSGAVPASWGVKKSPARPYLGQQPLVRFPVKCQGVGRRTTARDILRALAQFNVQEDQIRAQLNSHFLPECFWVDMPTQELQKQAELASPYSLVRFLTRPAVQGPRRMQVVAETVAAWRHGTWHPFASGSKGRFVLMSGIQENATMQDLARHLNNHAIMPNAITFLREDSRPRLDSDVGDIQRARHRAIVRMMSSEEASRAVRDLTNSFLLNHLVRLRTVP